MRMRAYASSLRRQYTARGARRIASRREARPDMRPVMAAASSGAQQIFPAAACYRYGGRDARHMAISLRRGRSSGEWR